MYKLVFLEERVAVNPSEIAKKEIAHDLDSIILEKLKKKVEGRCIASGYVKPDSVEILHRSMGAAENARFTGNYIYYIKLRCRVFHPETDTSVECKVIKVNKMGAYAVLDEAMRILVPRDLHIGNVEFDKLSPDDNIMVQVLRSRFQTNDAFISGVGMFISRAAKGAKKVVAPAETNEEEEETNEAAEEAVTNEEEETNEAAEEAVTNKEEETNEEAATNEEANEEEEEEEAPPTPPPVAKTRGRPRRQVVVSPEPEVEGVAVPTAVKGRARKTVAPPPVVAAAPATKGRRGR